MPLGLIFAWFLCVYAILMSLVVLFFMGRDPRNLR